MSGNYKSRERPSYMMAVVLGAKEAMGCGRIQIITLCSLLLLFPVIHGWGTVGHLTVCRIAQVLLTYSSSSSSLFILCVA